MTAGAFVAELSDGGEVAELVGRLREAAPTIDALVNNAGIARTASIENTSAEDLDRHYAINVRAPFLLSKELLPALEASRDPRIVNVASVVAHKGYVHQGAYAASQHALLGLSKVMATELSSKGILVWCRPGACPGSWSKRCGRTSTIHSSCLLRMLPMPSPTCSASTVR